MPDLSTPTFFRSGPISPLFAPSSVACDSGGTYGSTNTRIKIFTNAVVVGTDITYATSPTLGDTFTINTPGIYQVSYTDGSSANADNAGVSLNSAQLTTDIGSITTADRILMAANASAGGLCSMAATFRANAGDVVRAHGIGTTASKFTQAFVQFRIVRIG